MRGSEPSRVEPSTLWLKATKEVFENFPYNGRSEISVLTFLPPLMDYRCGFVGFICMYALVFLTLKLGTPQLLFKCVSLFRSWYCAHATHESMQNVVSRKRRLRRDGPSEVRAIVLHNLSAEDLRLETFNGAKSLPFPSHRFLTLSNISSQSDKLSSLFVPYPILKTCICGGAM